MKQVYFLILLLLANVYGCKKQGNLAEEYFNLLVHFRIENAAGQSLLDPGTSGHFKAENIRKYDLVDGEEKLYYKWNLN